MYVLQPIASPYEYKIQPDYLLMLPFDCRYIGSSSMITARIFISLNPCMIHFLFVTDTYRKRGQVCWQLATPGSVFFLFPSPLSTTSLTTLQKTQGLLVAPADQLLMGSVVNSRTQASLRVFWKTHRRQRYPASVIICVWREKTKAIKP